MDTKSDVTRLEDYPGRTISGPTPRISVVTIVRNGEKTLERAIRSVRAQAFPMLEYIIIDAVSTDGTHDIIRAHGDFVTHWISEQDRGISDGFNKGIALTRGEYVTLLNADDWLSPGQLAQGIKTLDEKKAADFVFGDLLYHDSSGAPLYRIRGEADYARRINHIMPALNHPTVIVRRSAYERHGLFDINLNLAMDYEMLLRFHKAGCRGVYDPDILGHMALEGASDVFGHRALAEVRDIAIRHGGWAPREWLRYAFRLAKGESRRMLEKILPSDLYQRLRGGINRNYFRLPQ